MMMASVRVLPTVLATFLVLAATLATGLTAAAQAPPGSIAKIKERGKLLAGVKLDTPPFGFLDDKNEPAGFDIDLVRKIGERIGVPVELVKVTSPTRIPLLVSGNVDLVAASMTHTRERDKAIDFSITYYTGGQSLLVPEGEPDRRRQGPRAASRWRCSRARRWKRTSRRPRRPPRWWRFATTPRLARAGAGSRRRAHRQPARAAGLHEGQPELQDRRRAVQRRAVRRRMCAKATPTLRDEVNLAIQDSVDLGRVRRRSIANGSAPTPRSRSRCGRE